MAVQVTGVLDGVPFEVMVDRGRVSGHRGVAALVAARAGDEILATPTGPRVTVDFDDPQSVVALLASVGTVTGVTGLPAEPVARRLGVVD